MPASGRLGHWLASAATVAGVLGASLVGSAEPAAAAGYEGYCTDSRGVTVVVDFQQLGGGVVVRCAPAPLPDGGTGLSALQGAGVPYEGVRRWGDAFICRLYGQPSASRGLAVTGHPDYHEACVDTPPSGAYWGYWSAPNGGSWTYSQSGVKSRRAIPGGFEGWSFSLNTSSSSSPAPRLTPMRPAAPASSASTPRHSPSTSRSVSPGVSTSSGTTRGPGSAPPARSTGTGSGTPPATSRTTSGSATARTTTTPGTEAQITDSTALAARSTARRTDGPSTTTLLGAGLLAFLAVAGAGTAVRRRRE